MTDHHLGVREEGGKPVGFGRLAFAGSRLGWVRGHDAVVDDDGILRYCDDHTPADAEHDRPCAKCGLSASEPGGPDPCLGRLPGVRNACCGHGVQEPYIEFENGLFLLWIGRWQIVVPSGSRSHFSFEVGP